MNLAEIISRVNSSAVVNPLSRAKFSPSSSFAATADVTRRRYASFSLRGCASRYLVRQRRMRGVERINHCRDAFQIFTRMTPRGGALPVSVNAFIRRYPMTNYGGGGGISPSNFFPHFRSADHFDAHFFRDPSLPSLSSFSLPHCVSVPPVEKRYRRIPVS